MKSPQVFIQGNDMKSRNWGAYFAYPMSHMTTWRHMLKALLHLRRSDIVILRYQNNPKKLTATLAETLLLILFVFKARLLGSALIWICHNVDRDTSDDFMVIQKFRRGLLMRWATLVLVLDPLFLDHLPRKKKVRAISFGAKIDGEISDDNMTRIMNFAAGFDKVILIAGQDGGKYKAFASIPELYNIFAAQGLSVGIIAAGISPERCFEASVEACVLRILEKNICESELTDVVNFIYRENDDISVPFTLYAAATAHIPILTRKSNILAQIVERENIGLCLGSDLRSNPEYDFSEFLKRHQWSSLAKVLRDENFDV